MRVASDLDDMDECWPIITRYVECKSIKFDNKNLPGYSVINLNIHTYIC